MSRTTVAYFNKCRITAARVRATGLYPFFKPISQKELGLSIIRDDYARFQQLSWFGNDIRLKKRLNWPPNGMGQVVVVPVS